MSFVCLFLFSFTQRQAFDSALLLSVLSIHFLIGKFQAFFSCCVIFLSLPKTGIGMERYAQNGWTRWQRLQQNWLQHRNVFLEEILVLLCFLWCGLFQQKMNEVMRIKKQDVRVHSCLLVQSNNRMGIFCKGQNLLRMPFPSPT